MILSFFQKLEFLGSYTETGSDSPIGMHIHNYNKCITITYIINFMHSYQGLIQVLMLITALCLSGSPVGVTELILMQNLYL